MVRAKAFREITKVFFSFQLFIVLFSSRFVVVSHCFWFRPILECLCLTKVKLLKSICSINFTCVAIFFTFIFANESLVHHIPYCIFGIFNIFFFLVCLDDFWNQILGFFFVLGATRFQAISVWNFYFERFYYNRWFIDFDLIFQIVFWSLDRIDLLDFWILFIFNQLICESHFWSITGSDLIQSDKSLLTIFPCKYLGLINIFHWWYIW